MTIIADITGRPVNVCADCEVSAAGAAILARGFLDRAAPPAVQAAGPVPLGRQVVPDPSTKAAYDALFEVYRRMYPALRGLFHDLAAAAGLIPDA